MKHKIIFRILLTLSFLLLLGFPALSLEGARKGLLLWYNTVLPTLLPFMICMNLMVSFGAVNLLAAPFYPVLHRLLGLSRAGSFILLSGMLCGYPMGAKNCSDFLDNDCLSLSEARCLYAVSSFPSPMFLAGYMMHMVNSGPQPIPLPLWKMAAAVYLPALFLFFPAAACYKLHRFPKSFRFRSGCLSDHSPTTDTAGKNTVLPLTGTPPIPTTPPSLDEALLSSMEVMVKIGGYIMLFSILAVFIRHLPLPGTLLPAFFITVAEMTTGIEYASLHFPGRLKILLIGFGGAFGGLSGAFQVRSVTKNAGLSIRHYLFWKTAHGLFTVIILILLAVRH